MKYLPDFELELMQATDFILSSELARIAFKKPPFDDFSNIVRDIIEDIDRLAHNCHLPEFTDHALPHICSLVKRISDWGVHDQWLEHLTSAEAGYLLIATLIHDIGMLSQNPEELGGNNRVEFNKGMTDVASWVRRTHVDRIEGLLNNLSIDRLLAGVIQSDHFKVVTTIAKAHQNWPWQKGFEEIENVADRVGLCKKRARGLAAIVAVADLLDEGNSRCDTKTLIRHRQGTLMNKAHWIRHTLTANRVDVKRKTVTINFVKPPNSGNELEQVYRALRNHYKLVKLYNEDLKILNANIEQFTFNPSDGVPHDESSLLGEWSELNKIVPVLAEQLLMTFMPEARGEKKSEIEKKYFVKVGLEELDLSNYYKFIGRRELLTEEEMIFGQLYK